VARLLTIGQFAELTGLTPRALRLYACEGLLSPCATNPETGYRYYTQDQAEVAARIRLLRSIDLPLEDIHLLLEGHCDEDVLLGHRRRIEARIRCYTEALTMLEGLEQRDVSRYRVGVKEVPAEPVIYKRLKTSLRQIETVRARAFGELYGFLRQSGVSPTGPGFSAEGGPVALYRHAGEVDVEAHDCTLDVGVPVPEPIPNACFNTCMWPAGKVTYILHTGDYVPLFLVYRKLARHLLGQGLTEVRGTRELYHVGYAETGDKNRLQTEVQFYLPP